MSEYKVSNDLDLEPKLVRRFQLSDVPTIVDPLKVSRTIVPVTNYDSLAKDWNILGGIFAVTVAAGITAYTVPAGKRLIMRGYYFALSTGDRQIYSVLIREPINSYGLELAYFSATTAYRAGILNQDVVLPSGWSIEISCSGGSTDGNYLYRIYGTLEDDY